MKYLFLRQYCYSETEIFFLSATPTAVRSHEREARTTVRFLENFQRRACHQFFVDPRDGHVDSDQQPSCILVFLLPSRGIFSTPSAAEKNLCHSGYRKGRFLPPSLFLCLVRSPSRSRRFFFSIHKVFPPLMQFRRLDPPFPPCLYWPLGGGRGKKYPR